MNTDIFGQFYNPMKLISYNRPWLFCIGSRSVGKSTGWMIEAIDHYLKTGKKFLYVRRTDDEVKATAPSACDNAVWLLKANGYSIHEIHAYKGNFILRQTGLAEDKGEVCGSYIALSQAYKYKSANFSDYDRIIYDEFMVDDNTRYLGSINNPLKEYTECTKLYRTVDRGIGKPYRNETLFIFIANMSSYYCPLFIGLGIDRYIRPDAKFIAPKDTGWVVEQVREVEATKNIDKSWASLVENDKLRDYNDRGMTFLDTSDMFIERVKKPVNGFLTVNFRGTIMGVYYIKDSDQIYISSRPTAMKPIALTVGDQGGVDYTIVRRPNEYDPIKRIRDYILKGRCLYESRRIKMMITTYMNLLPTI